MVEIFLLWKKRLCKNHKIFFCLNASLQLFPLGISHFLAVRVYILFKIHVFIAMRYLSAAFRLKRILSVWNSCKSLAKPLVKL